MLTKIKQLKPKVLHYVDRLRDVRFAGLVLFVVIVLLISWSGVKVIQTNYDLQKQISTLQQQVSVQQLQNENLTLQNQYYNTPQYRELAARQNFGLGAPGEKELLVPKNVALAHTVNLPSTTTTTTPTKSSHPFYVRNLQAWLHFFLHQQNTTD